MVKVYVAVKRRTESTTKWRAGTGIRALFRGLFRSVMPADGRSVDIGDAEPLGFVPMNVGQVLEIHLGLAAKGIGFRIGEMLRRQADAKELREFLDKGLTPTDVPRISKS